ncbi:recombinase family protein [Glutamicibacter halophytocola]|uniref:recombinase family protein n=1 Tax=Glutamicibacter halophytocola TaxID=1933880 RepID=UPI001559D675|nr:recombinase family protein [Glutamicibacter halophytocola]NQD42481.1 recombinase family protein [Glutamicibacter halophytocola]
MKPRIGLYLRISLDDEGEGLGVGRQEKDLRQLLERRGWIFGGLYVDNNKSAYQKNVHRPNFERLLSDLRAGVIDGMATYDLDRIARQPRDLERLIDIYEDSGRPFSSVTNDIDLSTPDGIFMARMLVNVANKSSKDSSRRIKRKNLERWENGLPHGSRRPYGYNKDMMTLHPIEAPIFKELGEKFLNGWSYKELAYWMNEAGHETTTGKLFYPITIANMLKKERYAGIRTRDGVVKRGIWEPMFDEETWALIQFKIAERKQKAGNPPVAKRYLMTGMLVCGKCGSYLNGETKRDHPSKPLRPVYICRVQGNVQRHKGCGGVTRDAVALEHFIREAIIFRLDSQLVANMLGTTSTSKERLTELLKQREAKDLQREALLDDYVDGTLTKADYQRATARVDQKIQELDTELDAIKRESFNLDINAGESVRDAWMKRPDGWRRELMKVLIKEIIVHQGITKPYYMADGVRKRFDPTLVEIKWLV